VDVSELLMSPHVRYFAKSYVANQGRRQKIFQGGQRKKRPKNSKKGRKIALFSHYLLYLYQV